jgi:rhodanese-related sulfurtransferase
MSENISAEELAAAHDVRIIDIRKAPDDQQIPGSETMVGDDIETAPPFGPDEKVVLYCGSGNSCSRIAATLRDRGLDVVALQGGYKAWKEAGLPTVLRGI